MFFFFFDRLFYIHTVQSAFESICSEKMLVDGYIDMNYYINSKQTKEELYNQLLNESSEYCVLFNNAYPKQEKAFDFWEKNIGADKVSELSFVEANAIVVWIYKIIKKREDRIEFTSELFSRIKSIYSINNHIKNASGIFYNEKLIDLRFISTLEELKKEIFIINRDFESDSTLFFRGHSNSNYYLLPSIMRDKSWKKFESEMYLNLVRECPISFADCKTHIDYLVKMQHYGLPTRLLDITSNPLVALFFACESNKKDFGEIVLIEAKKDSIKHYNSDTVSILASLPLFSEDDQSLFREISEKMPTVLSFNSDNNIQRLLHEIKTEKPAFMDRINPSDVLNSFVVLPLKSNERIIKQDGAFIICGLIHNKNNLGEFRCKRNNKRVVIIVTNKENILKELDLFSINHASLFPEMEEVAKYLKEKYSNKL